MLIGIWRANSKQPVYHLNLIGREIASLWIGLPDNGDYASILVCSPTGFTTIERISMDDALGRNGLAPNFAISDAALFSSLRSQFHDQASVRLADSKEALARWFCDGNGQRLFNERILNRSIRTSDMGTVIRMP